MVLLVPTVGGLLSFRVHTFATVEPASDFVESLSPPELREGLVAFWVLQSPPDPNAEASTSVEVVVLVRDPEREDHVHLTSFVDMESAESFVRLEVRKGLDLQQVLVYWAALVSVEADGAGSVRLSPSMPPSTAVDISVQEEEAAAALAQEEAAAALVREGAAAALVREEAAAALVHEEEAAAALVREGAAAALVREGAAAALVREEAAAAAALVREEEAAAVQEAEEEAAVALVREAAAAALVREEAAAALVRDEAAAALVQEEAGAALVQEEEAGAALVQAEDDGEEEIGDREGPGIDEVVDEVRRVLEVKRWDKSSNLFGGFESPPGKF